MSKFLGNVLAAWAVWRAWRSRRRFQWVPIDGLGASFDVRQRDVATMALVRFGVDPEGWLR